MKYLGPSFDIHAGGVDLLFPHHENEIAQSEATTGKKFVNYWIHGEHMMINNQKMSKSLGNFFTLNDLESKGFDPMAFRYLILTSHYRSKLNFTWKSLEAAQNALRNLTDNLRQTTDGQRPTTTGKKTENYEKQFLAGVNDDLNTPKAMAVLWKAIKDKKLSAESKKRLVMKFNKVLGLKLSGSKPAKIPENIRQMADEREKMRINKQFIQADALRKK